MISLAELLCDLEVLLFLLRLCKNGSRKDLFLTEILGLQREPQLSLLTLSILLDLARLHIRGTLSNLLF